MVHMTHLLHSLRFAAGSQAREGHAQPAPCSWQLGEGGLWTAYTLQLAARRGRFMDSLRPAAGARRGRVVDSLCPAAGSQTREEPGSLALTWLHLRTCR